MEITISRILDLIKENKTNAKNVEICAGLSNGSIYSWKNGKYKPSAKALEKLADYFGVPLDYLLGRTDERKNARNFKYLRSLFCKRPRASSFGFRQYLILR